MIKITLVLNALRLSEGKVAALELSSNHLRPHPSATPLHDSPQPFLRALWRFYLNLRDLAIWRSLGSIVNPISSFYRLYNAPLVNRPRPFISISRPHLHTVNMAPQVSQDSFIDEEDDTWYVFLSNLRSWSTGPSARLFTNLLLSVPSAWKSSIYRIRTSGHVLAGTR